MKVVVLSDTHAPNMLEYAFKHIKQEAIPKHNPEAIVINGDILGIFSMSASSIHKKTPLTPEIKLEYLRQAAPRFIEKYAGKPLTKEAVIDYVQERYEWCIDRLKEFANLKHTYFNMGNHESPYHFLVMQEIPFLLGTGESITQQVSREELQPIFAKFEQKLEQMEKSMSFTYIRNKPMLVKDTLLLPIPGESHDAIGNHPPAIAQENKTKELIQQAKGLLKYAKTIVIYNHTQGNYDRSTGMFEPLSPALKEFMQEVQAKNKVFVQSHNHWSYTQFLIQNGFHFVLNNAGLHGGIYNILDTTDGVETFDVHPETNTFTKLTPSDKIITDQDAIKLIRRNYRNFLDVFMYRRSTMHDAIHPSLK